MNRLSLIAAVTALVCLTAACGNSAHTPNPPAPPGVTLIPGGPMEPTPSASHPNVPTSQQEAQDAVVRYLQRTVNGLPSGTRLDSRESQGGSNLGCDDDYQGPGPGPTEFSISTRVIAPDSAKPDELVAMVGNVWQGWGLDVMERNGFEKPNRFAYPPDGYRLQITAAYPSQYPPTLTVMSPCFPGELRRDDLPTPTLIPQN